jgi:hypothetical protein
MPRAALDSAPYSAIFPTAVRGLLRRAGDLVGVGSSASRYLTGMRVKSCDCRPGNDLRSRRPNGVRVNEDGAGE